MSLRGSGVPSADKLSHPKSVYIQQDQGHYDSSTQKVWEQYWELIFSFNELSSPLSVVCVP